MVPEIRRHDRRSQAPMAPHWRATCTECAPKASREGRRATADERHRDWFTTCAHSSTDTPKGCSPPCKCTRAHPYYQRWRDATRATSRAGVRGHLGRTRGPGGRAPSSSRPKHWQIGLHRRDRNCQARALRRERLDPEAPRGSHRDPCAADRAWSEAAFARCNGSASVTHRRSHTGSQIIWLHLTDR